MSYQKITSFATKDTMADTNPLKVIRGKEFDDEFNAITTAMVSQDSTIANLITTPHGGIIMYGAAAAPDGFLLCDGAARSRTTYTTLFQAIGTAFGAGDGSTTFNVPNLSGRFPYGGALAQLGGSADAALPSHTHTATTTLTDPGHAHTVANVRPPGGYGAGGTIELQDSPATTGPTSTTTTGITVSTAVSTTGVNVTNANLPPFIGLSFIIKT